MPKPKATSPSGARTRGTRIASTATPSNLCHLKRFMGEKLVERFGPLPDAVRETMVSIGFYFFDRIGKPDAASPMANANQHTIAAQSLKHVLGEFQKLTQNNGRKLPKKVRYTRCLPDLLKSSLATSTAATPRRRQQRLIDILTIHQALDQLDLTRPEWSLALQLKYFHKLTLQEMSSELSLSIQQVRTQLLKAEEWMRQYMVSKRPSPTASQQAKPVTATT